MSLCRSSFSQTLHVDLRRNPISIQLDPTVSKTVYIKRIQTHKLLISNNGHQSIMAAGVQSLPFQFCKQMTEELIRSLKWIIGMDQRSQKPNSNYGNKVHVIWSVFAQTVSSTNGNKFIVLQQSHNSTILIKRTKSNKRIKNKTVFHKNPNPLNHSFIC